MINSLLPAALYTHHMPQGSGSGPSGHIIGPIVGSATNPDGSQRLFSGMDEDFEGQFDAGAGTAGELLGTRLTFYKDAGTITSAIDALGGILNCVSGAVADEELTLKGGPGAILDGEPVFFEARISPDLVNAASYFVGLADPSVAAADQAVIDGGDALVDANFMGFLIKDNKEISFVMRKAGAATTELVGTAALGVADGWLSLGFIYSRKPLTSSHEKLQVYKNNVSLGNVTGVTLTDALTPKNVVLAPIINAKSQAAATFKVDFGYCHTFME